MKENKQCSNFFHLLNLIGKLQNIMKNFTIHKITIKEYVNMVICVFVAHDIAAVRDR